jgi:hypothetical protein
MVSNLLNHDFAKLLFHMAQLEELRGGIIVKGILPNCNVTIVDVKRHGDDIVELVYKDASGNLG